MYTNLRGKKKKIRGDEVDGRRDRDNHSMCICIEILREGRQRQKKERKVRLGGDKYLNK
jgi:hypothetical protein